MVSANACSFKPCIQALHWGRIQLGAVQLLGAPSSPGAWGGLLARASGSGPSWDFPLMRHCEPHFAVRGTSGLCQKACQTDRKPTPQAEIETHLSFPMCDKGGRCLIWEGAEPAFLWVFFFFFFFWKKILLSGLPGRSFFFSIHQHFEWDYSLFIGGHPAHCGMLKNIPPPTHQMPVATSPTPQPLVPTNNVSKHPQCFLGDKSPPTDKENRTGGKNGLCPGFAPLLRPR